MTLLNTVQLNAQGSLKNVILDTTQLSQNGKKIKKKTPSVLFVGQECNGNSFCTRA